VESGRDGYSRKGGLNGGYTKIIELKRRGRKRRNKETQPEAEDAGT